MHFLYAYAFGVDQPGWLALRFDQALPTSVDARFMVFFGVSLVLALLLARLPAIRRGAAWVRSA